MNLRPVYILSVLASALAFVPLVQAGPIVIFTNQTRATDARAEALGGVPDFQSDMAVDFNIFESLIEASSVEPFTSAYADASQLSTLGPESILASGSAAVALTGPGTANASSTMQIVFQLDQTVPFEVSASIRLDVQPQVESNFVVGLQLLGPAGTVFQNALSESGASDLDLQGILEPGEYIFLAEANVGRNGIGTTRGTFSAQLVIPEPITATLLTVGALFIIPRRRSKCTRS